MNTQDREEIRRLIVDGADVNARDDDGDTALHRAVFAEHPDNCRALIDAGADVNAQDHDGRTPLMCAISSGDLACVRVLLHAGANPDLYDKGQYDDEDHAYNRNSALTWAVEDRQDGNAVQTLLEAGADVNTRDQDGRTPLMRATERGRIDTMQLLIDAGADVNACDRRGDTALMAATEISVPGRILPDRTSDSIDAADRIREMVTKESEQQKCRTLITAGAAVNAQNTNGETALHDAARCGAAGACRELTDAGAQVNVPDKNGRTALLCAAWSHLSNADTVRVLIDAGADVNAQDHDGRTALHYAAQRHKSDGTSLKTLSDRDHVDACAVLLAAGADIDLVDKRGDTAMDMAQGETRSVLVAHRERAILEQVTGQTDAPARRRTM